MTIDPCAFLDALRAAGLEFVTGVPDSLLKAFCACAASRLPDGAHVTAVNEGAAVALAMGQYLATGRPGLVYMQNSGLGNAINPMASLADPLVYGIPMVLLVGWRGEIAPDGTQQHDEPQHRQQGRVTLPQLAVLDIPARILDGATDDVAAVVRDVTAQALARPGPAALVVRKGTFAAFSSASASDRDADADADADSPPLTREAAIARILDRIPDTMPVVSTTGMASRELFELRKARAAGHHRDFLTVGGMGHANQIATGIAMADRGRRVLCLDGDGAMLMHMGSLVTAARQSNLVHVVLNNGAHDSVGGQPTAAGADLDLPSIAASCGYVRVARAATGDALDRALDDVLLSAGPGSAFLEVRCRPGARADLGRPDRSPQANKADVMSFLQEGRPQEGRPQEGRPQEGRP